MHFLSSVCVCVCVYIYMCVRACVRGWVGWLCVCVYWVQWLGIYVNFQNLGDQHDERREMGKSLREEMSRKSAARNQANGEEHGNSKLIRKYQTICPIDISKKLKSLICSVKNRKEKERKK